MYLKLKSDTGETLATGSDIDGLIKALVNQTEILKRRIQNVERFYNPELRAHSGERVKDFLARRCPYCKSECHAEWCDVEVGFVQVSPFHCEECGATQIGPYDDRSGGLMECERKLSWYCGDMLPNGNLKWSLLFRGRASDPRFSYDSWFDRKIVADYIVPLKERMKEYGGVFG